MTKAMEKIKNKMEDSGLSESTVKLYLQRLKTLNEGREFKSFSFLNKPNKIMEIISELKKNTQMSYYGSLITIIKLLPKTTYELSLKKYTNEFLKLKGDMKENPIEKKEIPKEDEITELKNKYVKGARAIKSKQVNKKEYNMLLHNLLLSLYTDINPRRNQDYMYMKITEDYENEEDKENFNWYDKKNKKFIFNKYKTSKKYGSQEIDISKNKVLLSNLKMYLKHRIDNENWLLVKWSGEYFKQVNDVTRELNKIFGGNISANSLRHYSVTNKYKDLKEVAASMGHSVITAQTIYNDN
jgi:hypothetical protein